MKKYLIYFIFLSLAFLVIALIKADYLIIPRIDSWLSIALSFLILFVGFIVDNISWAKTLQVMGKPASIADAIASGGFSVFGKYIPGKVWTLAGRSAYIAKRYNYNEKDTINISVQAELLSVWMGLTLGSISLYLLQKPDIFLILSLGLSLFFGLIMLWSWPHSLFLKILKLVFKKEYDLPLISAKKVFTILPWFIAKWSLFGLSFWLLARGLGAFDMGWYLGMIFPLGATLGLLAIIMPGGIGVREGLLSWYLSSLGIDVTLATTIGVSSRLWFLAGEFFIFLMALIIRMSQRKRKLVS